MGLLGLAFRGVEVNRALGDDRDGGAIEVVVKIVGLQWDGGGGIVGMYEPNVSVVVSIIIIIIKEGYYFAHGVGEVLDGTGIAGSVTVGGRMTGREMLARVGSAVGSARRMSWGVVWRSVVIQTGEDGGPRRRISMWSTSGGARGFVAKVVIIIVGARVTSMTGAGSARTATGSVRAVARSAVSTCAIRTREVTAKDRIPVSVQSGVVGRVRGVGAVSENTAVLRKRVSNEMTFKKRAEGLGVWAGSSGR